LLSTCFFDWFCAINFIVSKLGLTAKDWNKMTAQKKDKNGIDWVSELPEDKDYDYWSDRFKDRQDQYDGSKEIVRKNLELNLPEESVICLIGDQHVGSPEVDYDRIEAEVKQIMETDNVYIIIMGDTVDGYFWGGDAQYGQMEQAPEQYQYIRSMMDYLGEKKKLICAIGGDHDGWSKRGGFNPIKEFTQRNHCFYSQGITYITINIGQHSYRITAAHRLPGNSMYNRTHQQNRALRFGSANGSDIVVAGHTHKKGISEFSIDKFGGASQKAHVISLGAYKKIDEYGMKLGFSELTTDNMYGCAVKLAKDRKHITTFYDVLDGIKSL